MNRRKMNEEIKEERSVMDCEGYFRRILALDEAGIDTTWEEAVLKAQEKFGFDEQQWRNWLKERYDTDSLQIAMKKARNE